MSRARYALASLALLGSPACKGTLDLGRDRPAPPGEPVTIPSDSSPLPSEAPSTSEDAATGPAPPSTTPDSEPSSPPSVPSSNSDAGASPSNTTTDSGSASPPDAGDASAPRPALPFDDGNPVLLMNDSPFDNWFVELAVLQAATERINLVGMVVNTSPYWPDLESNRSGVRALLDAARASGLQHVPALVSSQSDPFVAPEDRNVDSTAAHGSRGAQYIIEMANQHATPDLPLVVITGSTLTDIADAYLMDRSIAERIIAVATLGFGRPEGSILNGPNGDLDVWAGNIVTQRLRFVQVSSYYEQIEDVPEARLGELPANEFGDWIAGKRGDIGERFAADQTSLVALTQPDFGVVRRLAYAGVDEEGTALLQDASEGCCWLVSQGDAARPGQLFWQLLADPTAFVQR